MWLREPSDPVDAALKLVVADPSPQSTVTAQGVSGPGSVKDPRSKLAELPSSPAWSAGAVTAGGTFATWTTWTDSLALLVPPSESCILILTLAVAGPLGKKHWKLPLWVAWSKL